MIGRVGVVGAGVMGSEIAQSVAAAGLDVALLDSDPDALARGLAHIEKIGERRVAKGRLEPAAAAAILERVTPTEQEATLATCDLAIEAVPEILELKRSVFRTLDAALPPHALLASNTSGLSITALADDTGRPDQVLGLHFFNPASVMRLVEVVRGARTSEKTMTEAEQFAVSLGKSPVRVQECPGFLVNRVLVRGLAEAYGAAGPSVEERAATDQAVAEQGPAPMGPFALGDLIGLDTLAHLRLHLEQAYGERFSDAGTIEHQVEQGRLGTKAGGGFFDADGAPQARADGRAAAERFYEGALDEARRCVAEGVASAEDTDLAIREGCGWSAGPLEWARESAGLGSAADH